MLFLIIMEEYMKLKEQYQKLKLQYLYHIILIKSGNFYVTFDGDASVFYYLFNYQITENKVGFPINNIDKILFELRENQLNYIIVESDEQKTIQYTEYSNEPYQKLLEKSKKYELEKKNHQQLLEKI